MSTGYIPWIVFLAVSITLSALSVLGRAINNRKENK